MGRGHLMSLFWGAEVLQGSWTRSQLSLDAALKLHSLHTAVNVGSAGPVGNCPAPTAQPADLEDGHGAIWVAFTES